jgi:NADH dehydrogenase FAD-containing subunit
MAKQCVRQQLLLASSSLSRKAFATPLTSLGHARRLLTTEELDRAQGGTYFHLCLLWTTLNLIHTGRERIVILGSGWAGYTLARKLDDRKYQTVVVSPRSYFVFTPLVASTASGTLEFRTAAEPIRKRGSDVQLYQGWADDVNFDRKTITVEENISDQYSSRAIKLPDDTAIQNYTLQKPTSPRLFDVHYDKLVIAVGCYSQTFGVKGVKVRSTFT